MFPDASAADCLKGALAPRIKPRALLCRLQGALERLTGRFTGHRGKKSRALARLAAGNACLPGLSPAPFEAGQRQVVLTIYLTGAVEVEKREYFGLAGCFK